MVIEIDKDMRSKKEFESKYILFEASESIIQVLELYTKKQDPTYLVIVPVISFALILELLLVLHLSVVA